MLFQWDQIKRTIPILADKIISIFLSRTRQLTGEMTALDNVLSRLFIVQHSVVVVANYGRMVKGEQQQQWRINRKLYQLTSQLFSNVSCVTLQANSCNSFRCGRMSGRAGQRTYGQAGQASSWRRANWILQQLLGAAEKQVNFQLTSQANGKQHLLTRLASGRASHFRYL